MASRKRPGHPSAGDRKRIATPARRRRQLRALEDWWIAHAFQPDRDAGLAELDRRLG